MEGHQLSRAKGLHPTTLIIWDVLVQAGRPLTVDEIVAAGDARWPKPDYYRTWCRKHPDAGVVPDTMSPEQRRQAIRQAVQAQASQMTLRSILAKDNNRARQGSSGKPLATYVPRTPPMVWVPYDSEATYAKGAYHIDVMNFLERAKKRIRHLTPGASKDSKAAGRNRIEIELLTEAVRLLRAKNGT